MAPSDYGGRIVAQQLPLLEPKAKLAPEAAVGSRIRVPPVAWLVATLREQRAALSRSV